MSLLPVLSLVFSALGGVLAAVGAWVTRRFGRVTKKDTEIMIRYPDGTTDEIHVGGELPPNPAEVEDVVRETLEKDQGSPPASTEDL